jgi:hypothetical protein
LLVVLIGVGVSAASAQEQQTPAPPPAGESKPVTASAPPAGQQVPAGSSGTATPASATAAPAVLEPLAGPELRRRREAIDAIESLLPSKVKLGARDTMDQLQTIQPGMNLFTTSAPRARGFHLDGYGVFFYVEIPGVRPSVASIVEQLQRERNERGDRGSASRAAAGNAGGGAPIDANALYTEAVKRQLIDALLDYSHTLDLRPSEWVTIAARDGDEPIPNVIYESITLVLRVRGADLADFRSGRISRPEMLKRVEVRGF